MKKGHFFIIGGVAGAGKGTLTGNLRKLEREDFYFPLSYKTRPKRPGEVNGIDAHFITREEFKNAVDASEFLEYAFVHNLDYYGTKFSDIFENGIEKGLKVIKEIEYQGVLDLQKNQKNLMSYITTIFLDIPDKIMVERMKGRDHTISKQEIQNRLESAKKEREFRKNADYKIDTSKTTKKEVLEKALKIINK